MEPTLEKRLTLEEWQDKIAQQSGELDFESVKKEANYFEDHSSSKLIRLLNIETEALKSYYAQEVSFLQSQIPQWVSPKDGLPDNMRRVLFTFRSSPGTPFEGSYHSGSTRPFHCRESSNHTTDDIELWCYLPLP